jgi:hypothetical protein
MTTLLASRDTIGLDSPALLQDSTTHELDDVLTPLTAEELEMDGGNWWEDVADWGLGAASAVGGAVDYFWSDSPAWLGPVSLAGGAGSAVWGAFLLF